MSNKITNPEIIDLTTCALLLGMSEDQLRRKVKDNLIPVVEGIRERGIWFSRKQIESYIQSRLTRFSKGITITIGNQKGGVGKTTATHNICYELASRGHEVLAIDLDPQQSLTSQLNHKDIGSPTIYTLFNEYLSSEKIKTHLSIVKTDDDPDFEGGHKNLDLIAGDERFNEIQNTLNVNYLGMRSLQNLIREIRNDYDFIFFDTPPSKLDTIIQASLIASDYVIVPQYPDFLSTEAMDKYIRIIKHIQQDDNPELKILGAVITRHNPKTDVANLYIDEIQEYYTLFNTRIKDLIQVAEAQHKRLPLRRYERGYEIAEQYSDLVDEMIEKLIAHGEEKLAKKQVKIS